MNEEDRSTMLTHVLRHVRETLVAASTGDLEALEFLRVRVIQELQADAASRSRLSIVGAKKALEQGSRTPPPLRPPTAKNGPAVAVSVVAPRTRQCAPKWMCESARWRDERLRGVRDRLKTSSSEDWGPPR